MQVLYGKIETAANIAIIVVAVLVGSVIASRYVLPASTDRIVPEQNKLQAGSQLQLSGVDWNKSDKTLLLVLSTTCRFCVESTPFYQKLSQAKQSRPDVRILAVMSQPIEESSKYLKERNIFVDAVQNARPGDLQVNGTPTLILVDREGKVVDSWIGKLPLDEEKEVFSAIFGNSADI